MSETFAVIAFAILGLLVGILVARLVFRDSDRVRDGFLEPQAQPSKTPIALFCRDCGKTMQSVRSQQGFDVTTGQPRFTYQRVCADATQNVAYGASNDWPFCGNTVLQQGIANAHNHTDDTPHVDCPTCIDQMVTDKVVSPEQAGKMYAEIGVVVPMTKSEVALRYGYLPTVDAGLWMVLRSRKVRPDPARMAGD